MLISLDTTVSSSCILCYQTLGQRLIPKAVWQGFEIVEAPMKVHVGLLTPVLPVGSG